jgi:hypothetical protein
MYRNVFKVAVTVHQASESDLSKFPVHIAAEQMTDAEARHISRNMKEKTIEERLTFL